MSPRTKEQFAEMREQKSQLISEKALELFAEHGYEATSISMIAKEAGVSKGLIYNYFSSKEEILKEIIEHVVSSVWERLGIEGLEKVDKADMEKFIEASIDLVIEDPQHYRLYFAIFTQKQVLNLVMEDMMKRAAPYIKLIYTYYAEQGIEQPEVWMRYMSASVDGIQMHIMLDPEGFPAEEVKKLLLKQFT